MSHGVIFVNIDLRIITIKILVISSRVTKCFWRWVGLLTMFLYGGIIFMAFSGLIIKNRRRKIMKRKLSLLVMLILALSIIFALPASADTPPVDGFYYDEYYTQYPCRGAEERDEKNRQKKLYL